MKKTTHYLNAKTVTTSAAMLVALLLVGCSKQPSSEATPSAAASAASPDKTSLPPPPSATPAAQSPVPAPAPAPASTSTGPRIKGVALGDSPDDVKKEVLALIPGTLPCKLEEKTDGSNPFLNVIIRTPYGIAIDCGTVPTDPNYQGLFEFTDGRLTKFTFGQSMTAFLFSADKIPFADFVKAFINAYEIPRVDSSENGQFLAYRDTDKGWELDIYQDKSFMVYAIETASEQSKKFN